MIQNRKQGRLYVNINDMTEQQLNEYTKSQIEDDSAITKANIKQIEGLIYESKNNIFELINLENIISEKDSSKACDKISSIARAFGNIATKTRTLMYSLGIKDASNNIRHDLATEKNIKFDRREEYLNIIIPEMLPHKPQIDMTHGTVRYAYDIDQWRASYYEAFAREFINGKYNIFTDKVSICYIIHVPENMRKGIPDTDNFDTKVMTDIITNFLLKDDNFICCNYFVDVVIDKQCKRAEECFTEIIVCPADKRGKVLEINKIST